MNHSPEQGNEPSEPKNQPAINLPWIVTVSIGLLAAVHLASTLILDEAALDLLFGQFGYIPQRSLLPVEYVGNAFTPFYSLFSHAFLHVDWQHLFFNVAWLAVFGSPVARRYGVLGFIIIFILGSAVGAIVFAGLAGDRFTVLIGASGAVSAFIGCASRFMFQPIKTAVNEETGEVMILGRDLVTFVGLLRNRRALTFVGFWMVLNIVFGLVPELMGASGQVAWQAHLGGFIVGYFGAAWLEQKAF